MICCCLFCFSAPLHCVCCSDELYCRRRHQHQCATIISQLSPYYYCCCCCFHNSSGNYFCLSEPNDVRHREKKGTTTIAKRRGHNSAATFAVVLLTASAHNGLKLVQWQCQAVAPSAQFSSVESSIVGFFLAVLVHCFFLIDWQ